MSGRTLPKVAVIMGGLSAEREVSLSSGRACVNALRETGYDAVAVDAGADVACRLTELSPDAVFNVLHGRWGEDGCVQGMLEWLRIPYSHSGVLASALAMDKARAKAAFARAGIPVADGGLFSRAAIRSGHVMAPPYVVKPNDGGSSVGVIMVPERADRPPDVSDGMPETLMVEAYVAGRELTVTVMGDRALCVTEIVTDGWYDYEAKYVSGASRHELPANVPEEIAEACLMHARAAHDALGCRGVSRMDFRWDDSKGPEGLVALETNTQPGMTSTSLVPEQAAHLGTSFPDLCDWIVKDSSCDR